MIIFIFQCTIWGNELSYQSIKNYLGDFVTSSFSLSTHTTHFIQSEKSWFCKAFLFSTYRNIHNMTKEVVNSPFIAWPQINLPASFQPRSDRISITNQVHFTKVEIRPSPTNAYYKRTCLIEFRQKSCVSLLP